MVARKILEGLRFDIDEAEDGQKAIEACQRHMPDAVLLDWNMPVKNGLEFLQELRAMQNGNQPIVVFCTTENDMEHIKTAIEAGANENIMKRSDERRVGQKGVRTCVSRWAPEP